MSDADAEKEQASLQAETGDWWTDERVETWGHLDEARQRAVDRYREEATWRIGVGGLCHTSAPNPNGISADHSPDQWYYSAAGDLRDPNLMATLLADELDGQTVTLTQRTEMWEDGYWFLVGDTDD